MADLPEDDPLLQRMFKAAMGQADAEETAAWREIAKILVEMMPRIDRMLARYEPEDRERVLKSWMDAWVAEEKAKQPTRH